MKEYDISVIIPMYNAEKYIGQCIESVLNQTKDNIEIVVVNDGSTDSSLAISKAYADNHDNVLIIDKPNQGVISARIAGLNAAHGTNNCTICGPDSFPTGRSRWCGGGIYCPRRHSECPCTRPDASC